MPTKRSNRNAAVALVGIAAAVGLTVVILKAKGQPGPPSGGQVSLSASSTSTGIGQVDTFSGSVTDPQGGLLPGTPVTLYVNGAQVVAGNTNSAGSYSLSYAFLTAGSFQCYVLASTIGVKSPAVTVTVNAPVLGSIGLVATAPTTISPGQNVSFAITTKDATGAPLSAISGQMDEGGVSVGASWTTDAAGNANITLSFAAAGTFSVTAVSGATVSPAVIVTVTSPPPMLKTISFTAPVLVVHAGGSITFTIATFDQNGAPMPSVSGQLTENGAPLTGSAWTTGPNGQTSLSVSFATVGTDSLAATSGLIASPTLIVTVSANPVLTTVSLSANITAIPTGGNVTFTAVTKDQSGLAMSGISVQPKESGSNIGNAILTDATGTATFTLGFPTAGVFLVTVTATQGAVVLTSAPVTITVTNPQGTAPVTVAITANIGATKADCNHKLFFAQGRFWLWYLQENNIVYISSVDKVSWSAPGFILNPGLGPGEMFDVFYDVATSQLYFVQALSANNFKYGIAVLTSTGNITWTAGITTVTVAGATGPYGVNRPTIRPDSLGNIFVSAEVSVNDATLPVGHGVHVQVFKQTVGVWSTILDVDTRQASTDYMGILGKFTGGKMCLYYGTVNGGNIAYLQDWSGTAWGPQINLTGPVRLEPMNGGGLTLGDTLYWGGFDTDSTGYIGFFKHVYGDTTVPVQTQLSGANANLYISDGQGCISSDGVTSLVVFYSGSIGFGTGAGRFTVYFRTSTDLGNTWGPETVLASGETGIQGKTLQSTDIASTREIQVAWTSNPVGPYAVRFATLIL